MQRLAIGVACAAAFVSGSLWSGTVDDAHAIRVARAARTTTVERGAAALRSLLASPSLVACGTCHDEVHAEWSRSLHHSAWTNANVQHATRNFERAACRPCHSPMPSLQHVPEDGPAHGTPDYRDFNQADGVHCLSCHARADGRVAARHTVAGAPCEPVADPRLLRAESCEPCHQPTHQAFDEYRRSVAAREGTRCADCHMPEVQRGNGTTGRSHGPHGGFSPDFVRGAIDWSCRLVTDGAAPVVEVTLTNRCGHKFPGEIPSRSFVVTALVGGQRAQHVQLRRPFKKEIREDNRLEPDESRVLRFTIAADTAPGTPIEVELTFHPLPVAASGPTFAVGGWRAVR